MENDKAIWVRGNKQPLLIPLEQEVIRQDGEMIIEPYYPEGGATVNVYLVSRKKKYHFRPTVDGNLLSITDNGNIPAGCYGLEVTVINEDDTPFRSYWPDQVVVTDSNPSVLQEWNEFKQQGVQARAALFFFAKGDYSKPAEGIPASDLTQELQDLLARADSIPVEPGTGEGSMQQRGNGTNATGKNACALGQDTRAAGNEAFALGDSTVASGNNSVAEGHFSHAVGSSSHAEGKSTNAAGDYSHAEGNGTSASGDYSHAEGNGTTAVGVSSHAEGVSTLADGMASHAGGTFSISAGNNAFAHGDTVSAPGESAHAEGVSTTASGKASHAEGRETTASGFGSHAEGNKTEAGDTAHAEGYQSVASGQFSHAEGEATNATHKAAHAEGGNTKALQERSHAEGDATEARGFNSHSEGDRTVASGNNSHAEGRETSAEGNKSHAEGYNTHAIGENSHAEGYATHANGTCSHAEGCETHAIGTYSHAEGYGTQAIGTYSHAGGDGSEARVNCSFAHGFRVLAVSRDSETAFGRYNKSNVATLFSIGFGDSDSNRKNAFEIMKNGRLFVFGLGGYDGTNPDSALSVQDLLTYKVTGIKLTDNVTYDQAALINHGATTFGNCNGATLYLNKDTVVTNVLIYYDHDNNKVRNAAFAQNGNEIVVTTDNWGFFVQKIVVVTAESLAELLFTW